MSKPEDHDNDVTRRRFLATSALAAGAMALPRSAFAVEDEFAATSGEKVYFRGWQYKPDVVQDNVDKYNKLHSGKVDYQTVTGDYPAIMEKSLIAGDNLDMIYANPPTAVRFMEAGWIKPADDLQAGPAAIADMYPKVREAWTHKGKVLGLSYFLSPRGIVAINRQKQDELGVKDEQLPKNWDEFYAHIDDLAAKGAKDIYLPHWFNEFYGISWAFLWEVINRGGTSVDPKTRAPTVTVDNAAGKTLAAWKKLWKSGHVPEEVLTYTEANLVDAFASGRFLYSTQAGYNLAYFNDKEKSKIAGKVGFIPYRGQAWGLLDSALYLTTTRKRSPALEADVSKFVSYYGFKDTRGKVWVGQTWMENSMLFSGYKSVMESAETKESLKGFLSRESDVKELLDLYAQTEAPNDVWQVVWAEELNAWLRKRLADFLLKDDSVETVIADISAEITTLNKKYKI